MKAIVLAAALATGPASAAVYDVTYNMQMEVTYVNDTIPSYIVDPGPAPWEGIAEGQILPGQLLLSYDDELDAVRRLSCTFTFGRCWFIGYLEEFDPKTGYFYFAEPIGTGADFELNGDGTGSYSVVPEYFDEPQAFRNIRFRITYDVTGLPPTPLPAGGLLLLSGLAGGGAIMQRRRRRPRATSDSA